MIYKLLIWLKFHQQICSALLLSYQPIYGQNQKVNQGSQRSTGRHHRMPSRFRCCLATAGFEVKKHTKTLRCHNNCFEGWWNWAIALTPAIHVSKWNMCSSRVCAELSAHFGLLAGCALAAHWKTGRIRKKPATKKPVNTRFYRLY
jgi:hypothetical protein